MRDPMHCTMPDAPSAHETTRLVCRTVDSESVLDVVWLHFGGRLERLARRMTRDVDLQVDLVQEARIALWQLDATRFNLRRKRDRAFLRRMLKNRMWNVWRSEMSRRGMPDPHLHRMVAAIDTVPACAQHTCDDSGTAKLRPETPQ